MSIIKSFSVGYGDMYYIIHNSDNFTMIDCCFDDDTVGDAILKEVVKEARQKGIYRFISTHPDLDHIKGLKALNEQIPLVNFYCVKNQAKKEFETEDFKKYCELRDSSDRAFYLYKGCSRKWMNVSDEVRKQAGIEILWPDTDNKYFKQELENAKNEISYNNISPIIKYDLSEGIKAVWMGDLETNFMKAIETDIELTKIDVLFAPHHGRDNGKVPQAWLDTLDPKIIVIGEAPAADLNYYRGYNTITQNSAGDIIFDCVSKKVHIYVSNKNYSVSFLTNEGKKDFSYYLGTLNL